MGMRKSSCRFQRLRFKCLIIPIQVHIHPRLLRNFPNVSNGFPSRSAKQVLNAQHYSFSDKNETSYRPTNDDCLMRTVTTPNFCKVCLEGLWLSLLRNVNLIDDIREDCSHADSGVWVKTLNMSLVPLAQFRPDAKENKKNESYTILWQRNNRILHNFTNKTMLEVDGLNAVGKYAVEVKFATDEVRLDRGEVLTATARYEITSNCGIKGS
jgi:hypothetical protein